MDAPPSFLPSTAALHSPVSDLFRGFACFPRRASELSMQSLIETSSCIPSPVLGERLSDFSIPNDVHSEVSTALTPSLSELITRIVTVDLG